MRENSYGETYIAARLADRVEAKLASASLYDKQAEEANITPVIDRKRQQALEQLDRMAEIYIVAEELGVKARMVEILRERREQ